MTKIDFYIIAADAIEQRHLFACRLVEKAFKLGHSIYIHSDDNAQANAIDQCLWNWRNSSFLPHSLANSADEKGESILLGYGEAPRHDSEHQLLINLSHSVPDFFSRFERVMEVVVQVPSVTESTRNNYRFYRDRGYSIENHDLRK